MCWWNCWQSAMLKRQECGFRCEEVSQSSISFTLWFWMGEERGEEGWWMDETWMVDECDGWSMLLLKETKSRDAWNFPTPPELWRSSLYTRVQVESLKLQFFGSLILGVDKLSFIVQVLESLSKSKVETPIHDSIRGLITWDCKEHGVKSWMY